MMLQDHATFLKAWLKAPKRIAAIAPSGPALARLMTRELSPREVGQVVELGPGLGSFTKALLTRGFSERDLTLVELDARFVPMLRRRFPEATVLHMSAANLTRDMLPGEASVGAFVSGLPLLAMPEEVVEAIVGAAFGVLRPGGALYQFTYGPACPIRRSILQRLGLRATRTGRAVVNLPPAAVYRVERLPEA